MSLASRLSASSRRPTATVRVAGARWADWLSLSRDQSYGGNISGGTVVGRALPSAVAIGTPISWSWGYDGYETAGFSGVVSGIDTSSYPNRVSLTVADPLWAAGRRQKDIATDPINNIAASTAITQILSGAGLTRLAIPALAASGSAWAGDEWVMGTLTPVAFANSTALAAAQRIAETLGYWLYADASGVVRAVLLERRPSDSPFRTLRWGEDFVIAGTPSRRQPDTRKNRVVIKGAATGVQGAQIRDAWQEDPGDRSDERTFELIEYVNEAEAGAASITGVARRVLRLLNRDPNIIEIPRLKADPRLSVGMTLAVQCARIGYAAPKPFFVYSLSAKLERLKGDFAQSLTLDGGTGGGGYTLMPPPLASFAWRLVAETLDGTAVIEVFLDGSGSVALGGGEIVSYAWSTATAVASGYASTASGPKAMLVFPAATLSAAIALTVMDTSSKTGTITQTVPLAGDATSPVTTRTIIIPLGAAVAVTPDGGATWAVNTTGDAILTPETNGDTLITTTGTGGTSLRTSADAGTTWSTGAALGGSATALDRTVGAERLWIAVGAALYLSTDKGATKALWGTLPATIAGVLEDPAVLNSVFVLAGANVYHSTLDTPGTAWAVLYAGPAGATARQLVRGASGATTWVAYTGTFIGSPLQRVEGPIVATFPVVTPDVTEIRAVALAPDELTVYAWDSEGRGWRVDSATGIATAISATLAAGETAMHALHDPDEPIVYLATFGSVQGTTYKYFPLADSLAPFYVPASGQQSHRVGLGAGTLAGVNFVAIPQGASGGDDYLWVYSRGIWRTVAPPVAGAYWFRLAICPFRPAEWLLVGNSVAPNETATITSGSPLRMQDGTHSVLWHTDDAGATWTPIDLAAPATTGYSYGAAWWCGDGSWVMAASYTTATRRTATWRGSGASVTGSQTTPSGGSDEFVSNGSAVGQNGDLYQVGNPLSSGAYADQRAVVVAIDGTSRIPAGAGPTASGSPAILPGTRAACYVSAGGVLYATADYRAAQPTAQGLTGLGGPLAPLADGSLLVGGIGGISRITDPLTAPALALAYAGSPVIGLASDTGTRTIAVAVDDAGGFALYDGAAWVSLPSPLSGTPSVITSVEPHTEAL
jgi:hypothetical protein